MIVNMMTLKEINRLNAEFWADQDALLKERMADRAVLDTAIEEIAAEARKGIAPFSQSSIYEALANAERVGRRFISQFARKGGRAGKTDRLQTLIEEIVQDRPNISVRELEAKLRRQEEIDPIQEIDDGIIFFTDAHDCTKRGKLSGLKDRLSRAKKKIRSR
jgi:hypothetical protein